MISEYWQCEGDRVDTGEVVRGYYFPLHHPEDNTHMHHMFIPLGCDLSKGTPIEDIQIEVKPETVRRVSVKPNISPYNGIHGRPYNMCPNCSALVDDGKGLYSNKVDKHCRACGMAISWPNP